jgi:RNA polymerase sigma-70 factor (ECF subfamily)
MTVGVTDVDAVDDRRTVDLLREGDEEAFATLLRQHHAWLVRLAMSYVRERAIAEDVAQDTWLAVINGIDRFEGRSSLRTWITRILINQAKSRAVHERRTVPFPAGGSADDLGPTVDPERFADRGRASEIGHWICPPSSWEGVPEERLVSEETRKRIAGAIDALPPIQRRVIELRDVEGWLPHEVCALLHVSEGNQRVLLHRARAKVRAALVAYLDVG